MLKQWQELLKSISMLLDEVLSQGEISDANMRVPVKSVIIHQNEDKSIDVHFEMNGFSVAVDGSLDKSESHRYDKLL